MKALSLPLIIAFVFLKINVKSQSNSPAVTSWLRNTTGITGRHYVSGNSTPITDAVLANVQSVKYSANWVYVSTNGIPSYITGPFLDGNTNLAGSQNAIFKISLNPVQNTGTLTATTGGNIGIFINGVALFDYRDGASWQLSTQSLKGGPYGGAGDGVWNRDAIVGEKGGFDCSKGHPAGTNYHHHQNPSAFKLDLSVISTICNLYNADGLYVIDPTKHSPLIGYAYDGFPIYGAYGYKNKDGSGGIVRIKSGWTKRNITIRNTLYTGASVTAGPAVSTTYPIGYFKEDYQFVTPSPSNQDSLDIHNGRFCVTPEYPDGIYAYFATVDANWNSSYPYAVGPTFYGTKTATKPSSITESVTTYTPATVTTLNLKVFIQGVYNTGQAMDPVLLNSGKSINALRTDSITVELHASTSPYSLIESVKGIVTTDGKCALSFSSSRTGSSYYIVVKHRNSIETWSKLSVPFTSTTSYDFTQ